MDLVELFVQLACAVCLGLPLSTEDSENVGTTGEKFLGLSGSQPVFSSVCGSVRCLGHVVVAIAAIYKAH